MFKVCMATVKDQIEYYIKVLKHILHWNSISDKDAVLKKRVSIVLLGHALRDIALRPRHADQKSLEVPTCNFTDTHILQTGTHTASSRYSAEKD